MPVAPLDAGSPRRPTTLAFTATYNEIDNIATLVDAVLALDVDLLVVDDDSPDGTGQWLRGRSRSEPRLFVHHRAGKLGLGSAHRFAMQYAIDAGYRELITLDADGSHDPAEIPALIARLDTTPFVTGSRYAPGGGCDYHGWRRLLSRTANQLAQRTLGMPLSEYTTSCRAFRVDMLRAIGVAAFESQSYSFFLESVVRIHRAGFEVSEYPIHFHERRGGTSKIPRFEILRGIATLASLIVSRYTSTRARTNSPTFSDAPSHRDERNSR